MTSFSPGGACFGISYQKEILTIRITGFFIKTTLEGEIKTRFKGYGLTHCCAQEDFIISSHHSNNAVLCDQANGDLAWKFEDNKLQTPRTATVDENGCVLVIGETSNNVFNISSDGQNWREILNDIDKPYTIHHDKVSKLMVITNKTGLTKVFQKL